MFAICLVNLKKKKKKFLLAKFKPALNLIYSSIRNLRKNQRVKLWWIFKYTVAMLYLLMPNISKLTSVISSHISLNIKLEAVTRTK